MFSREFLVFLKLHMFTPRIQIMMFPDVAQKMQKSKFSLNMTRWTFSHKCSNAKASA